MITSLTLAVWFFTSKDVAIFDGAVVEVESSEDSVGALALQEPWNVEGWRGSSYNLHLLDLASVAVGNDNATRPDHAAAVAALIGRHGKLVVLRVWQSDIERCFCCGHVLHVKLALAQHGALTHAQTPIHRVVAQRPRVNQRIVRSSTAECRHAQTFARRRRTPLDPEKRVVVNNLHDVLRRCGHCGRGKTTNRINTDE